MQIDDQRPKVGIGVMIFRDGKILVGKRKNAHGAGEFSWPGGHLEYGESFEDCARRETLEETGVEIKNLKFQFLANVKKYANKHYVHIGLTADWASGEAQLLEPEKCEGWDWYEIEKLPQPLFYMCQLSVEAGKTSRNYFDS